MGLGEGSSWTGWLWNLPGINSHAKRRNVARKGATRGNSPAGRARTRGKAGEGGVVARLRRAGVRDVGNGGNAQRPVPGCRVAVQSHVQARRAIRMRVRRWSVDGFALLMTHVAGVAVRQTSRERGAESPAVAAGDDAADATGPELDRALGVLPEFPRDFVGIVGFGVNGKSLDLDDVLDDDLCVPGKRFRGGEQSDVRHGGESLHKSRGNQLCVPSSGRIRKGEGARGQRGPL